MIIRVLLAFLVFISASARAASPLMGELQPGPHRVGFRVVERYDTTRPFLFPLDLDGKPRAGTIDRPMQISIWYPALAETRAPMTLGDYVELMATEQDFSVPAERRREAGGRLYFNFDRVRGANADQQRQLLALETTAVRDARPVAGKFPVVLWSLGSPAVYQASAEYLASHGYVVAIVPRLPPTRSLVDNSPTREDYDAKSRDLAFLIAELNAFPSADTRNVGVTGFSAGGRWALGEAMRNPNVRGVVSQDSILLFDDAGQFAQMPFHAAERMRVPLLHMVRRAWVPQETNPLWGELRFADRAKWIFEDPAVDHLDFASLGFASTLAGLHAEKKDAIARTFHDFNCATLSFFDWTLKHDAQARERLAQAPESVTVEKSAAAANAIDPRQLQEALIDGTDRALDLFARLWKESGTAPVPEATLNLAGYQLLALRRAKDALRAFELNAAAFPKSANVYDSLADGYQAVGDDAKAMETSKKAIALLDGDASLTAQRRELIRRSAEQRIEALTRAK